MKARLGTWRRAFRPACVPQAGLKTRLPRTKRHPSYPVEGGWWDGLPLRSSFTRPAYLDAVARVREYIYAGDIFQANLSQRFEAPLDAGPVDVLSRAARA